MIRPSRRLVAVVVGATIALTICVAPPASATPYDGEDDTISAWAPRHLYTIMSNEPAGLAVNYYFRFTDGADAPGAMRSAAFDPFPHTEVATLEIGYKSTGRQDCRMPDDFLQVGIPSASAAQVDFSEDSTDAVLWMSSLNDIREDQLANPTKDYYAGWNCGSDVDFGSNPVGEIGPYNVQLGHSIWAPPSPAHTFAERTFNLIPREEASRAIPGPGVNDAFHFAFDAPWLPGWNFETSASLDEWWTQNTVIGRYTGAGAPMGDSYIKMYPLTEDPPSDDPDYVPWSAIGRQFPIRGQGG